MPSHHQKTVAKMIVRTPFHQAAHDHLTSLGYKHTRVLDTTEDVGDAENGPKLDYRPAFDEYEGPAEYVYVSEDGDTGRQPREPEPVDHFAKFADDDIGATTTVAPKKPDSFVHRPATKARVTETCDKCRGSGNFVGYSGRIVGPCRPCRGTGKRSFAAAKPARDAAKQRAAERKVAKFAATLKEFTDGHPDVIAWINDKRGSFDFARSMDVAMTKFGSLTENQVAAVRRCIERDKTRAAEQAAKLAAAPTIECEKIVTAIQTAQASGLIKISLEISGYVFKPARKHPGVIYVTLSPNRDDVYLGKIVAGKLVASRDCRPEDVTEILRIAADPAAAARAHGLATNTCSCCGRLLTNPISVATGIGPICAGRFGF